MSHTTIWQLLTICAITTLMPYLALAQDPEAPSNERPNILWLTAEDIGPHLGCYGDSAARTPNLDSLAKRGMIYEVAWSNYPVCAPARSTIITGMYAAAHGAGHMRCSRPLPKDCKLFPQYLRERGYYCTNRSKEDYNHPKPGKVWDESSKKANYENRSRNQSFFAVINQTCTHESQIRKRPHQPVTDPATLKLPPYWPDLPAVRKDWGQYYDNIAKMDRWAGNQLKKLKEHGQAENTIIVFFGDHGSGMPRHKRFAGDSGMRVPLIVFFPEKWKHLAPPEYKPGSISSDPVGFIDLAPTMLSIAGVKPPEHMHGRAVAGKHQSSGDGHLYGFRARMDERPDLSRSVRDDRFVYIRNYMPHLAAGQFLDYQQVTPTTALWRQLFQQGKLNPVQRQFFEPHPAEELYDLRADPDETRNLALEDDYQNVVERFRKLHREKTLAIRDVAFMPESIIQQIAFEQPLQTFCAEDANYPIEEIFRAANLAASRKEIDRKSLMTMATSQIDSIRYWAAIALRCRGRETCRSNEAILQKLVADSCGCVAIAAAESTALFMDGDRQSKAVELLVEKANFNNSDFYSAVEALNSLGRIVESGESKVDIPISKLKNYPVKSPKITRGNSYIERLVEFIESNAAVTAAGN